MFEETLQALGLTEKTHKQINLALQGGGAHGAFTWGVLDRLLEDNYLTIDTISGTSAGAVNAVALAAGFIEDGNAGARAKLETIWKGISKAGDFMSIPALNQGPTKMMTQALMGMFAPSDLNPLDFDPLRDLLTEHIDFERLRHEGDIGLYIAATQVSDGKARIFETHELSVECVLASTCLPFLSKSIVIEGEAYWDGGFSANPALRPVILKSNTDDTLLVQLSPVDEFELPTHIAGIRTHLNKMSFNQSLRREIELIEEGRDVSRSGIAFSDKARRLSRHRFHLIDGTPTTSRLNPGSEMTPSWSMLQDLFIAGRRATERFLNTNRKKIGHKSTIDLKEHFNL